MCAEPTCQLRTFVGGKAMPRLMSVALTIDQVVKRQKNQTRRVNWWLDKNGNRILCAGSQVMLCKKVRGRRAGEPLEPLTIVDVVDVRREPLEAITPEDVVGEGFLQWSVGQFIDFYCRTHRGVTPASEITRIEWVYPRICRRCGCTECAACDTIFGPCAWLRIFPDNTGLCTACSSSGASTATSQ